MEPLWETQSERPRGKVSHRAPPALPAEEEVATTTKGLSVVKVADFRLRV